MEREDERLDCSACPFGGRCNDPAIGPAQFDDLDGTPLAVTGCPRYVLQIGTLPLGDPFAWAARIERGILPEPGGWLDQPNLFTETMAVIERLMAETRRRHKRRQDEAAAHLNHDRDRDL